MLPSNIFILSYTFGTGCDSTPGPQARNEIARRQGRAISLIDLVIANSLPISLSAQAKQELWVALLHRISRQLRTPRGRFEREAATNTRTSEIVAQLEELRRRLDHE